MYFKYPHRMILSVLCLCLSSLVIAGQVPSQNKISSDLAKLININTKSSSELTVVIELDLAKNTNVLSQALKSSSTRTYGRFVQTKLMASEIASIANQAQVQRIRLPYYAHTTGIITEAMPDLFASPIKQRGILGQGAHVVVLDVGFSDYTRLLGTELPEQVTMKNFNSEGSALTRHGTAVAELIYDLAPQAQLSFVAVGTDVEYLQAVDWINNMNPKPHVVNASIGFDNIGPLNNKSILTKAANSFLDNDILYVNAAGNEQQQYYIEHFTDNDHDGWHEFAEGDEFFALELNGEEPYNIILNWDDWGSDPANPHSDQNYDLYLWCPGTAEFTVDTACASSENMQSGQAGSTPLEIVSDPSPLGGVYQVGIKRKSGSRNNLLRVSFVNDAGHFGLEYRSQAGTITIPADGKNVLTVGAYHWSDVGADIDSSILRSDPGFTASDWLNDLPPEPFSSLGPTWDNRTKPDISGPDGVSTASFGELGFFGTSAATPHVVGAAALLKSESPNRNARELRRMLVGMSQDVQPPGFDNAHGAGRLSLEAAANQPGLSSRTGLWSNPQQQGHGFSVIIQGQTAVVLWYFYDTEGDPVWMLGSGPFDGTSFSVTLNKFTGPAYGAPMADSFDAQGSNVSHVNVGSLTMQFSNEKAHIDATLNGEDGMASGDYSVDVEMLVAGVEASEYQAPYITGQNGIWNDLEQMGHGLFQIRSGNTHSPDRFVYPTDTQVVIWYTYERETGKSQWLLASGPTNDAESYQEAGKDALGDSLARFYINDGNGFKTGDTLEDFFDPNHNPVKFFHLLDIQFSNIAGPDAALDFSHRFYNDNDSYSVRRFDFN
ncbi:MAG: S8 family serine peptidase [bacterium]